MAKETKINPGHNGAGKGKGHVEHGNGNGYGHDKHHAEAPPPPPPPPNYADGVITVVGATGQTQAFTTFEAALAFASDGDTLQVGAGVYKEVITLDKDVTILAEEGAVLDGSGFAVSTGLSGTIELADGSDGSTISGLEIVAIQGGAAVTNEFGVEVNGVVLSDNTFSAGANTSGALVYLNPGATNIDILSNEFEGEFLFNSPLLGIDATGAGDADIDVIGNSFGPTPASDYPEVEIFNAVAGEVVVQDNTGLGINDLYYGMY